MQPTVLRAVGYRRVSSQEQTEGHSLDAQTTHIQNFVQMQGWNLVKIYTDAGVSAKKGSQRPGFEQMLKDAGDGQFDVVVVDKIDRFYRHLIGLLSALEQLNNHGISFASVQEKLDFTTPWGKLMLTVLGMLAEIYLDNLRQETKKGHQQRARSGYWNGSPPFGYCKGLCSKCTDPNGKDYCPNYGGSDLSNGRILVAHPIESIGVKLAFEWYATGMYSYKVISEMLSNHKVTLPDGSERVIRQKGHKGYSLPGAFSTDMVRGMIQRLAYTGKLLYIGSDNNGKYRSRKPPIAVYDGKHPALISQELFDQAAKVREAYTNYAPVRANCEQRCFILTGILKCGNCGCNMRGVSCMGKYFSYDDGAKFTSAVTCSQKPIKAHIIESRIAGVLQVVIAYSDETRMIEILREQFAQSEERYHRAQELYLAGKMERSIFDREADLYEEQAELLHKDGVYATMTLYDLVRADLARWDELLPYEKKRLLRLVLEAAWVQGNALVAIKPTVAFRPIIDNWQEARADLGDCAEGGSQPALPKRSVSPHYTKLSDSGEGGIRTHGGPKSTTVFETAPFNHSGTSPYFVAGAIIAKNARNAYSLFRLPRLHHHT